MFFYRHASHRRRLNTIDSLFDARGNWMDEITTIGRVTYDYFASLFQTQALGDMCRLLYRIPSIIILRRFIGLSLV